jgi:hypothetical protein
MLCSSMPTGILYFILRFLRRKTQLLGCFYSPSRHTTPNWALTPHSALKCKFLYNNQFLVQQGKRQDSLPCPQFTVWILPFISKRISPLQAKNTIIFSAELNPQLRQSGFWKSDSPGVSWDVLMLHARPNLLLGFKVSTKAIWNPAPPLFDTIPYS